MCGTGRLNGMTYVDEDVTWAGVGDDAFWDTGVDAADPEDLGSLNVSDERWC